MIIVIILILVVLSASVVVQVMTYMNTDNNTDNNSGGSTDNNSGGSSSPTTCPCAWASKTELFFPYGEKNGDWTNVASTVMYFVDTSIVYKVLGIIDGSSNVVIKMVVIAVIDVGWPGREWDGGRRAGGIKVVTGA